MDLPIAVNTFYLIWFTLSSLDGGHVWKVEKYSTK